MSPAAFDALAKLMRQRPDSQGRELARLVLVEGLTRAEAARRTGASRQAVYNAEVAALAKLERVRRIVGASEPTFAP